ncbi:hypothetical protein ACFQDG_02950 [Natronoarchaeum mannanilyticum]
MLQATAAGGATALGVSGQLPDRLDPTADAEAAVPLVLAGYAVGTAAAAGLGYVIGSNINGTDQAEFDQKNEYEQWVNAYTDARAARQEDKTVLTSLKSDARFLDSKAEEEATFAIYETALEGGTESDALTAAKNAIDRVYSVPEKNLITWWEQRYTLAVTLSERLIDSSTVKDKITPERAGNFEWDSSINSRLDGGTTRSYELLNGETHQITEWLDISNGRAHLFTPDHTAEVGTSGNLITDYLDARDDDSVSWPHSDNLTQYTVMPPDTGEFSEIDGSNYDYSFDSRQHLFNALEYSAIMRELHDSATATKDVAQSLVDNFFQAAKDGDLNLADMLAPSALAETAANADDFAEAALLFRSMNIPQATEAAVVEIPTAEGTESIQDGSGSGGNTTNTTNTSDSTTDSTLEYESGRFEGILAWTTPDGNTLPVGTTVPVGSFPGTFYFAFNYEDDAGNVQADVAELTDEFTIVRTENDSDELAFETRQMVTTDTSPEDARKILVENRDAENEAREETINVVMDDGGGGPMFPKLDAPDVPGGWLGGAAIIGGTITAVSAFVSKVLP